MRNGKIITLSFILFILLFISFGCQSDEDDVDVGYEVTGTVAPTVDIIYSDFDGKIVQVLGQTSPWDTSFSVPSDEISGFLVFLLAQNIGGVSTDSITVIIKKDGIIFSQDTGVGATVVVSTSGNL